MTNAMTWRDTVRLGWLYTKKEWISAYTLDARGKRQIVLITVCILFAAAMFSLPVWGGAAAKYQSMATGIVQMATIVQIIAAPSIVYREYQTNGFARMRMMPGGPRPMLVCWLSALVVMPIIFLLIDVVAMIFLWPNLGMVGNIVMLELAAMIVGIWIYFPIGVMLAPVTRTPGRYSAVFVVAIMVLSIPVDLGPDSGGPVWMVFHPSTWMFAVALRAGGFGRGLLPSVPTWALVLFIVAAGAVLWFVADRVWARAYRRVRLAPHASAPKKKVSR